MKKTILTALIMSISVCAILAQRVESICPQIVIEAPQTIDMGEPLTFRAVSKDAARLAELKFEWAISHGTITSGQGTAEIVVDTVGLVSSDDLTATATVRGLTPNCENAFTGKTKINTPKNIDIFGYGKIPLNEEKQRLDQWMTELNNSTDDFVGLLLITPGKDESVEDIKKHLKKLIAHIEYRRFPLRRITFGINKKSEETRTTTPIAGTANFVEKLAKDYLIFKAEDL